MDRSGNGSYNLVFGNTKFNTIRVGYTYEKNGFTNRDVQADPPVALVDLPPTFDMLTFMDKTRNGALFRINNSYEVSDSYSQFISNWLGRRQRLQDRSLVRLFADRAAGPDGHERAVRLPDRPAVQPGQPVDVSGAAVHPRAVSQRHRDAGEHLRGLRPGQVAPRQPDAEPGRSLRPREGADQADPRLQSAVLERGRLRHRQEQPRAAARIHVEAGRQQHVGGSRRLRAVLRQGRSHYHRAVPQPEHLQLVVHRKLPDVERRPGPEPPAGSRPTRSC